MEGAGSESNEVNKGERIREEMYQAKKLSGREMLKEEGLQPGHHKPENSIIITVVQKLAFSIDAINRNKARMSHVGLVRSSQRLSCLMNKTCIIKPIEIKNLLHISVALATGRVCHPNFSDSRRPSPPSIALLEIAGSSVWPGCCERLALEAEGFCRKSIS